jgi:large subunit ribosomal protein L6
MFDSIFLLKHKMKKEIYQKIKIPEEVEVNINGNFIQIKGKEGENSRFFNLNGVELKKEGDAILVGYKKATKREKKTINTTTAHIKNMLKGVQEKFEYNLKICFSHFPTTVEVKGNEAIIKNFLGEKTPRKINLPEGIDVKVDKQNIKITSIDKEKVGQAAANFERITKVRGRDRRVFQDGIYLINKTGRNI